MARRLEPVHMVMCPECEKVHPQQEYNWCDVHDRMPIDMGWRVGQAEANYSWYSSRERALTDKRCK